MNISKKFLIFLILLSAFCVVGLIIIQYYWIKNAMDVHQANFDKSVNEAISKVIYQTEKTEIANKLKGKLKSFKKGSALFNTVDSINQLLYNEFEKMFSDTLIDDSIINITRERISIEIAKDNYGLPVKRIDTSVFIFQKKIKDTQPLLTDRSFTQIKEQSYKKNILPYYSPVENFNIDSLTLEFDKFLKRTFIVSDIFEDLFNFSRYLPIEERIDTNTLDSIIKKELNKRNINLEYEFGIFSSLERKFIYEKTGRYTRDLISKGQAFVLFPSDFFKLPNYLFIYFPNKKAFLFKQMSSTLIISFLLIISLFIVFFYILISFFKQKRLSLLLNNFISNMTHEFKTPISTIKLACEVMTDESLAEKDNLLSYKECINIIAKENARLDNITEKILQTAIIDNGQFKLKLEKVDIHQIISLAIKNILLQIEQNKGKIITDFKAEKSIILADKLHFTNIIYNLLDNANKYNIKEPEIVVKTYNNNSSVIIEVIDNGIGIPKKLQKRIFEKLYRVKQSHISYIKGFGLGLSYVKTITKMHKGKVLVQSEEGKGSTFKLIFKYLDK